MSRELSSEELTEAQEIFSLFSKDGKLAIQDVGFALRSFGVNPTNAEVETLIQCRRLTAAGVDFNAFKDMLSEDVPRPDSQEHVRSAFAVFDKDDSGLIAAQELKHILMSAGEKLSEEEVNLLLREADIDENGFIRYEQFVQVMTRMK